MELYRSGSDGRTGEDPRRVLGRQGEDLALAHLDALGYRLIERNHRTRLGEIDLIVSDRRTLVFVEVKTRRASGGRRGRDPAAAAEQLIVFTAPRSRQWTRARRIAADWLRETQYRRPVVRDLRFDLITVIVDPAGRLLRLDHLEGAY